MTADAEDLAARGVALANAGRYTMAQKVLKDAWETAAAAGDDDLTARIEGTTAYVIARTGGVEAGLDLCRRARERAGVGETTRAILAGQMGALELERGALASAVDWLTQGIEGLAGADGQAVRSANVRMNRSIALMQQGALDAAVADLQWAEAVFRSEGRHVEASLTVHNRGYVAMLAGDLVEALRVMGSVREPIDDTSDVWAGINELDHAEVLREAGLVTEAERSLEAVARTFGRARAPGERARAEYQLARSLLNHDPARAAEVAAASARRYRRLGSDAWAARAEGLHLRARLARGRIDRSGARPTAGRRPPRTLVDEVVRRLRRIGFDHDATALRLAQVLGDVRRDGSSPSRAPRVGPEAPLEVQVLAHEVAAERARAAGREHQARRRAAAGIDLLERSLQRGASLEQQGPIGMQGLGLIGIGLTSAVTSRDPAVVFEWSERSRHLNAQVVPLRPPRDPEVAAHLAEIRRLRLADPGSDAAADARAASLLDRARAQLWAGAASDDTHARVGLDHARERLADGDALFCYVFDGKRLVALVVTATSVRLVDLDWARVSALLDGLRADLDVSASVRNAPMARIVQESLSERLADLSRALVEPLAASVPGVGRIVVTVPGVLAGLPWAMLPALRGVPLTIASSVSRWVADTSVPRAHPLRAAFAAGPYVARAGEEVTRGAAAWKRPITLRGDTATVAAVTDAASRSDVLHVAAHGRHAADNPLFSGIELADGTLFGYDVDLIPDVPTTVILSACEVGRSSVRWGEEAVGMTRVWLHAGARCVMAAPVVVADDAACELLSAVHAGLAAGDAPANALARAQESTGIVAPFHAHGDGF
ncbi:CHAT domain-containing protein [Microbacterium koreense]|uniref:CHAT domain-containing protein n=1 Tax=Microbacterium koreense TaxID=323761 RepID=A0ABW2ZMC1_9MICO